MKADYLEYIKDRYQQYSQVQFMDRILRRRALRQQNVVRDLCCQAGVDFQEDVDLEKQVSQLSANPPSPLPPGWNALIAEFWGIQVRLD